MIKQISRFILLLLMTVSISMALPAQTADKTKPAMPKLTKEEFEKKIYDPVKDGDKAVYKGKIPCIVDFYADWCRPCKMLHPILEEIEKEYAGKVLIYKVNVDEQKALASLYGISSIPTLLLFPRKDKPAMIKGLVSKEELVKYIEEYLKP